MVIIKNKNELIPDSLEKDKFYLRNIALSCLERAIIAVKPENFINKILNIHNNELIINEDVYPLEKIRKIYVIGGGKASARMASSIDEMFRKHGIVDYEGFINVPEGLEAEKLTISNKIKLYRASHPLPNENGVNGVKKMMALVKKALPNDLILCLISGGGSSLLPLPLEPISIENLKELNKILLNSGASIEEINIIRKHVSGIKGGNLARHVHETSKARLISLIISDVIGDQLESIASGPTVPDSSTCKDALDIIKMYDIDDNIPKSVISILNTGLIDNKLETPKPGDECFNITHNYLIGSVASAVKAVKSYLESEEFQWILFSNSISGEARIYGKKLYDTISEKINHIEIRSNSKQKLALIGSGELTVTVKGDGIGGRNQEMLLSFLSNILNKRISYNFNIISVNLDGIEGNSKAMGAMIDNLLLKTIIEKKLNPEQYLWINDSNTFFKKLKSEIITGYTGCNVNDLIIILLIL